MNKNIVVTTIFSLFLVSGAFFAIPAERVHAFNILDPFCLFSDCDDDNNQPSVVDSSINNSYNNNTNSFNTQTQNNYDTGTVTNTTGATPTYNYGSGYHYAPSPLSVSCYPTPTYGNIGTVIRWNSSISGGSGSYHVSWTGTEGLSGIGSSITKTYGYAGSKHASVTVTSGGQTVSQNCSGSVTIHDPYYQHQPPVYNYNPYPNYNYYNPLTVSCTANTSFSPVGSYVTWTAYPAGGQHGSYTYSWSGTDNLYGSSHAISTTYHNPGLKSAYVTIYSGGQTASAQCSNTVTVGAPIAHNPYPGFPSGFQIACAAGVTSARVGVPVTWSAEATGAGYMSGFTYAWTGSDGLTGNQSSVVKTYSTSGLKSAVVTVTSPSGQSQSKSCVNTVSVKSAAVAAVKKPSPSPTPAPEVIILPPPPPQTASIFSLGNIPWGWVAVLIILMLLGIIFYLAFNRKKI